MWPSHKRAIAAAAAAAAKSLQSCPTLCDPMDGSPPRSPIPGILQARTWSGLPFPSPMHESEKWKWSRSVVPYSSQPHGLQLTRLLRPWNFPGKSTGVGCHCLLRTDYTVHGILQARMLEWVAFPYSRGSSQPRDQTQVSRIAGRFFTSWATREAYPFSSGFSQPRNWTEVSCTAGGFFTDWAIREAKCVAGGSKSMEFLYVIEVILLLA